MPTSFLESYDWPDDNRTFMVVRNGRVYAQLPPSGHREAIWLIEVDGGLDEGGGSAALLEPVLCGA